MTVTFPWSEEVVRKRGTRLVEAPVIYTKRAWLSGSGLVSGTLPMTLVSFNRYPPIP